MEPELIDPDTGEIVKICFFLMTLCWSRHQYAEIVVDQGNSRRLWFLKRLYRRIGSITHLFAPGPADLFG